MSIKIHVIADSGQVFPQNPVSSWGAAEQVCIRYARRYAAGTIKPASGRVVAVENGEEIIGWRFNAQGIEEEQAAHG